MSAIAVFFQRDGAPSDAAGAVTRALSEMASRGPDRRGVWSAEGAAIGHGLLATTPEDDLAPQPFHAEGAGIVAALDGRLDNRAELAAALGVEERGTADVALVAAAYDRWGEAFDRHLLGDFAVVIRDARRGALIAARDVVGARPLYYRESGGALVCGSSPWALFGSSEAPQPSFDAMAMFLAERHVERPDTLFEGVRALLPGGSLRATSGAVYVSGSAWPAPVTPSGLAGARAHEEALRATLRDAVRARMRARGRVAAHVSGGVDSSSVAALAASVAREEGAADPLLLRCVFPGLACDESAFSQAVADHLGLPIESVTMPGDVAEYLPDAASLPRGPFENPVSHILTRLMDRAAERGARVTLTGAGSDQLLLPTGLELAGALLRGDVRGALALSGILGAPLSAGGYARLLRRGVWRALPEGAQRAVRSARRRGAGAPAWMTPRARRVVEEAGEPGADDPRAFPSPAARALATRFAWSVDYSHSLLLADAIAASKGADLRHPFFDRRVIELLLSFPDEERAAGPPHKALLRRAMGGLLPREVAERTTAAEFSPFVQAAVVEPHGEALAALIRRGRLGDAGLVDPDAAADRVLAARADLEAAREVAALLSLELWLRQVRP